MAWTLPPSSRWEKDSTFQISPIFPTSSGDLQPMTDRSHTSRQFRPCCLFLVLFGHSQKLVLFGFRLGALLKERLFDLEECLFSILLWNFSTLQDSPCNSTHCFEVVRGSILWIPLGIVGDLNSKNSAISGQTPKIENRISGHWALLRSLHIPCRGWKRKSIQDQLEFWSTHRKRSCIEAPCHWSLSPLKIARHRVSPIHAPEGDNNWRSALPVRWCWIWWPCDGFNDEACFSSRLESICL